MSQIIPVPVGRTCLEVLHPVWSEVLPELVASLFALPYGLYSAFSSELTFQFQQWLEEFPGTSKDGKPNSAFPKLIYRETTTEKRSLWLNTSGADEHSSILSSCLLSLDCDSLMTNKIFAFFPFMGLWFHCLNLVLLTQRASISKLLKPNFLYQAPETDTNFHRIIHFFPLKKSKEKREKQRTLEWLFKGKSRPAAACVHCWY